MGASPGTTNNAFNLDRLRGLTSHLAFPCAVRTARQVANHQKERESVRYLVVASCEPPTSVQIRLVAIAKVLREGHVSPCVIPRLHDQLGLTCGRRETNHRTSTQLSKILEVRSSEPPQFTQTGLDQRLRLTWRAWPRQSASGTAYY